MKWEAWVLVLFFMFNLLQTPKLAELGAKYTPFVVGGTAVALVIMACLSIRLGIA